jgi:predicted transcriptional regulator YdeE
MRSFLLILSALLLTPPNIVHQSTFSVVGIEVRTSNARESSPDGLIGKQWQRFLRENIAQKIPDKLDANIYAVYCDYSSDHNSEYSFLIGAKVPSGSTAPAGLVLKTVPAGDFAVITTNKGPVSKVVIAAWQRVWAMEQNHEFPRSRAYKADYEVYGQRATDPQNSQVDLYIGLK